MKKKSVLILALISVPAIFALADNQRLDSLAANIGREVSLVLHLRDDDEFEIELVDLFEHGQRVFEAFWTGEEGAGRPMMKGTGQALSDPSDPLTGMRSFNRISGPDAGSCAACHNAPHGISGGGGDFVTNVFVLGQRFDFVSLDPDDEIATKGTVDEHGRSANMQTIGNLRATTGLFGAGYLELLAREITTDLQRIRDSLKPGEQKRLVSKGIDFGSIGRTDDGLWDVSEVYGISRLSLLTHGPNYPPTLIIRPWHQAGNVVSLREFSNNAFHHHHGMQPTERFGVETDLDGDGVSNELTRADLTAVTVFQAALPVPGRVIPKHPEIERAVLAGEAAFRKVKCSSCHIPSLPLQSTTFSEPGPFNPPGNLRPGDARTFRFDLNHEGLPSPRLTRSGDGLVHVPAFTDFRLHDITSGPDDPNAEALDMNHGPWSPKFASGNRKFLTKRLWGAANEPPYYHHGRYTTMRQAILAHDGEAKSSREAFEALSEYDRDAIIEFLKTLQVLPAGTDALIVDETYTPRTWPPTEEPVEGLAGE